MERVQMAQKIEKYLVILLTVSGTIHRSTT